VALVSGANKGIGFQIVKKLLHHSSPITVYLGAREEGKGMQAIEELKKHHGPFTNGSRLHFCKIDLENEKSIEDAANMIKTKYSHGLHILVNNAGMAYKGDAWGLEVARHTLKVNYHGTKSMCTHFLPFLAPNGRIVNVSSTAGKLSRFGKSIQDQINNPNLTISQLDDLLEQFVSSVKDNTYADRGWPKSTYAVSKLGVSTLTRILQRDEMTFISRKKPMIYACCPGYCQTDMSSNRGDRTAEQGAQTPAWLALEEPSPPQGFYTLSISMKEW
jgi:carbonyl reductase 1